MSPLFRRRRKGGDDEQPRRPERVPDWAADVLNLALWRAFKADVLITAQQLDIDAATIDEGVIGDRMGLSNLAQMYAQADAEDRTPLVDRHFRMLLSAADEQPDDVLAALRLRIFPLEDILETMVTRPVADDLAMVLVVDLPNSVRTLGSEDAGETGLSEQELFDRALHNTEADDVPDHETMPIADGATIEVFEGESFFVASRALHLHTLIDLPEAGAVVGIPNRHSLIVHPIEDLSVVGVLSVLPMICGGAYREGPGSISDQLYHVDGMGSWTRIPTVVDGSTVRIEPGDSFLAVLNGLDDPTA